MIKPQRPSTEPKARPPLPPTIEVEQTASSSASDTAPETLFNDEETDESAKFQGIGTLYGKIYKDEEQGFYIKLGQNQYRLYVLKNRYRSWLLQMRNAPDTPLYLRVYPKYRIIPRKPPEVYFQVVAWVEENQWEEPGMFVFRGIWQFIPQVRTPVISVYRNYEAEDPTEKFKAVHLPVLMRREDETRPFKFNPKIPKEQLPKRWFIQAEYKFIPSRNCWGWVKDVAPPSEQIPHYRKPVKPTSPDKDKAPYSADNPQETFGKKEQAYEKTSTLSTEEATTTRPKKLFNKPNTSTIKKQSKKSEQTDSSSEE
ncbi:MAG: hypothetical protein AB4041_03900 [Microcystaceae cyanobacterium]